MRAVFNDVWRSYAEHRQLWPQAVHMDAHLPPDGGRTLNCAKRRDSRRALTLSSPSSYMASVHPWAKRAPSQSQSSCFSRSSPALPTLPSYSPACRSAYAATFKCLSFCPPASPCLAAGQQHNPRRSRKMWGGGACDDRAHTFCVRRSPPQEPSETKRLPGAEGPPEGISTSDGLSCCERSKVFIYAA